MKLIDIISNALREGSVPGVKKWMADVRKKHGVDIKFWNDVHGGGAVNRIIASDKNKNVVGSYDRKTNHPFISEE